VSELRPPPQDPSGHAVHDAEKIAGDAWVQVLVSNLGRARAAAQSASAHCDEARRRLSAALLGLALTGIAAAYADLEAALAAARRAVSSYEQAHESLILELELLELRAIERRVDARAARNGEPATQVRTELPDEVVRPWPALVRISRRLPPWLVHVVTNLAAGRRSL
jgi:hypothetical protein